jgi:hypothetical protein
MSETSEKVYTGGCHCGRVRYEAATDLSQAIACNCSICARHGLWLTFVKPDKFKMVCGLDAVSTVRARQGPQRQGRVCHQCAMPG